MKNLFKIFLFQLLLVSTSYSINPLISPIEENNLGSFSLLCKKKEYTSENAIEALNISAKRRLDDFIEELINNNHEIIDKKYEGVPPLLIIAQNGLFKSCHLFLQLGANPNSKRDSDDFTPLQAASLQGHNEIVKRLIVSGADRTTTYKKTEESKQLTCKDLAKKHTDVVKTLDSFGNHNDTDRKAFSYFYDHVARNRWTPLEHLQWCIYKACDIRGSGMWGSFLSDIKKHPACAFLCKDADFKKLSGLMLISELKLGSDSRVITWGHMDDLRSMIYKHPDGLKQFTRNSLF